MDAKGVEIDMFYDSELNNYVVSHDYPYNLKNGSVLTLFELTRHDQLALLDLVERVRLRLVQEHQPDGFNIGLNEGLAAGQTVSHVHIHVIPRYDGDMADPRGGVRCVIPDKAQYWE